MGFPEGTETIVLTVGTTLGDGAADRDPITLTPTPPLIVSTTLNHMVKSGPIILTPDRSSGAGAVRLLATDASGYLPSGWTYRVDQPGQSPYYISLPAASGPSVDLADLTPVSADPGQYDLLAPVAEIEAYADAGDAATLQAAKDYTDQHGGSGSSSWVFDITSPAYGAVGDARTAADGAITAGTKVLRCTSAPFGGGHATVGMHVGIKGAGPTGVTWYRSTIASVDSSSQITLADTAATTVTGALVVWGHNNQSAIQAAVDAAEAYLAAGHGYAQVLTPPGAYIIDGPLNTSKSGNGQVVFGVYPTTSAKPVMHFLGSKGSSAVRHWEQLVPQTAGSTWISFGTYASGSAQTADINANGNAAVLCGPNEGTSNGSAYGAAGLYSNLMVVLDGLAILTAHSTNGWTYGAANLYGCANAQLVDFAYGTAGMYAAGDYGNPNTFAAGLAIGLLLPSSGNNDHNVLRNVSCGGGYTYGVFLTEHAIADRLMVLYCWAGVCPVGNYAGSAGATHAMKVVQASIEACTHELYIIGVASEGVGPIIDVDQLQTESGTPNVDGNSTAALMAALGRVQLTGLFTESGVYVAQPCGIELVNGRTPYAIRRVTSSFTVRPIDRTLICDTTGGGFSATLPDADVNPVTYALKNVGSNSLTVATTGSQLIYTTSGTGATTATVATGATLRVQAMYNGTAWGWYAI